MRSKVAHRALSALIVSMAMLAPGTATFSLARAAQTNLVVDWNQTMLSTFSAANVPPPPGNRLGAMVQTAVFDAVNGIERQYTAIHVEPDAPRGASQQAAAVTDDYTSPVEQ